MNRKQVDGRSIVRAVACLMSNAAGQLQATTGIARKAHGWKREGVVVTPESLKHLARSLIAWSGDLLLAVGDVRPEPLPNDSAEYDGDDGDQT